MSNHSSQQDPLDIISEKNYP